MLSFCTACADTKIRHANVKQPPRCELMSNVTSWDKFGVLHQVQLMATQAGIAAVAMLQLLWALQAECTFNLPAFARGLSSIASSACTHATALGLTCGSCRCTQQAKVNSCMPGDKCQACIERRLCHVFARSAYGHQHLAADSPESAIKHVASAHIQSETPCVS